MLIVDGDLDGRRAAVRVAHDGVVEVADRLSPRPGEVVLDAAGGAVLPGLHDHHVHLRALAAARRSLDLTGVDGPAAVDAAIRAAAAAHPAGGWLRVIGWYGRTGGELDRDRLDALTGGRPVRVQHRGGALWVLNSAGLDAVGAAGHRDPGVERDPMGRPTGRLWRQDDWLRGRTPSAVDGDRDALAAVGRAAAGRGVTGFTDATPGHGDAAVAAFGELLAAGVLPQRLLVMAEPTTRRPCDGRLDNGRLDLGPAKIVLDDVDLPTAAALAGRVTAAHRAGRPVAVHCVTADQLALTLGVLDDVGPHPGDRIEHAAVVPPGFAARLRAFGVTAVTQPVFVAGRGDDYLRAVPPDELPWLYPCRSLLDAGVAVAAGTDAPYGDPDPWLSVAAAVDRRTRRGRLLGAGERVTARTALGLFLGRPHRPAEPRTVAAGQPPDLCVLRAPLAEVLADPAAAAVAATVVAGRPAWRSDG